MQDHHASGHLESNKEKVVSIFSARQKVAVPASQESGQVESHDANGDAKSFDEVMRKNAENLERMRRERLQANKGVLKSYRIKD